MYYQLEAHVSVPFAVDDYDMKAQIIDFEGLTLLCSVDTESKLPILWSLAFKYGSRNWAEVMTSLLKLCTYFQQITTMKAGWGLLSVIGMQKQHVPTLRYVYFSPLFK